MFNGEFIIDRDELVEHLASRHIVFNSVIPIYFDDNMLRSIGIAEENEEGLICRVEEEIFDKCVNGETTLRFGYNLKIDDDGKRLIELNYVNLVPR